MDYDSRFKPRMKRRITVNFRVIYSIDGNLAEGMCVDLSAGGMLLQTQTLLDNEQRLKFSIIYDEEEDPIEIEGLVRYKKDTDKKSGHGRYGVVFDEEQDREVVSTIQRIINDPRYNTRFFRSPIRNPLKNKE